MDAQNEPADLPQVQGQSDDNSAQAVPQDGNNQPSTQPPTVQSDDEYTTEVPLPVEAEDSDLIEKEWVVRAKQIVEHTREDPYEQQRALSQMKADYLKKRYNKDIKAPDG